LNCCHGYISECAISFNVDGLPFDGQIFGKDRYPEVKIFFNVCLVTDPPGTFHFTTTTTIITTTSRALLRTRMLPLATVTNSSSAVCSCIHNCSTTTSAEHSLLQLLLCRRRHLQSSLCSRSSTCDNAQISLFFHDTRYIVDKRKTHALHVSQ